MDRYSIGKIARAANVSADTVRYYERMGLIAAPPRAKSGYRAYSQADLTRLLLIRRAREIGFSIEEIGELIALNAATDPASVQRVIQRRLASIDQRLAELRHWRSALIELQSPGIECGALDDFLLRRLDDAHGPYTQVGADH